MTLLVITLCFCLILFQHKPEPYRSQLPDYLLSLIDQVIKLDQLNVLRDEFLHKTIQEYVHGSVDRRHFIWLFIDPFQTKHIISKYPHTKITVPINSHTPPHSPSCFGQNENIQSMNLVCRNVLATKLPESVIKEVSRLQIKSWDQIRLRCEANIYTDGLDIQCDIRKIISWSQVYRVNSLKGFQYLSTVHQKIVAFLSKKDFFRKFAQIKQNDINRLMMDQIQFKMSPSQWPFVPQSFRQYEEIQEYVPTPYHRSNVINERVCSKKQPEQCPPNCVCLADNLAEGEYFCQYSLTNGWQTTCPNRSKKVQCDHLNEEDQRKCKNSEIRNHNKKKCKGKMGVLEQQAQIEERLTWGIDLYTRNIIYHCLPEFDIQGNKTKISNEERKYFFIEKTLSKALNFLGPKGYDIVDACNYIKKHAEINQPLKQKNNIQQTQTDKQTKDSSNSQQKEPIAKDKQIFFSAKDYEYADLILKNYQLVEDKSAFRIHTKGKGAICIDQKGINQGSFIVEYFGQIYQTWRWFDRQDFVKQVMKKKKFKNYMPEFYNISLEKHPDQPLGCDILMVDPSRKGNFSSRFSHSCDPNCGTIITVSNGRYYIGMYAFKDIAYGQELTFDYCSMTESNYQHLNSICLCGMRRCRGYYLQLSNTKMFSNLMDNKNCFYTRNSAILNSRGMIREQHIKICAEYNIKEGILRNSPEWLVRWIAQVLKFMSEEGAIYKQSLVDSWRKNYPWVNALSEEQKEENIQKYSLISRQQLQSIRLQNLITSVDKIKFFLSKNEQNYNQPPIFIEQHSRILDILIRRKDSVLLQLQQALIKYHVEKPASTIQKFLEKILKPETNNECKMSLFRLCCLVVSHQLLFLKGVTFNNQLLSDIVYFYAFTHTYFSPAQYKSFDAEEITVSVNEILGKASPPNEKREKSRKKYASPFLWGQMASWFKQTIVCPEASLSQDRRGTLSYPLISSIMRSEYPYQKQSRAYFLKMIMQKPANSWPPAPGCDLSFKNPYKLYGTILFENVHSRNLLFGLPKDSLLESCLSCINSDFNTKLQLFKIVENTLGGMPGGHPYYEFAQKQIGDLTLPVPLQLKNSYVGEPRKRVKREEDLE